jgi:N-acetylglucosaminyldiphosphoundecaprenol N-acetyl-beta-D-mannosaminyltransferase
MKKALLLNSYISVGQYSDFVDHLISLPKNKRSSYVCISNVHMLIEAYHDKAFNGILNNADVATPDGVPLAKCLSFFYKVKQERVAGMDLFPSLMKKAEENNMSVYFFGSTEEVLDKVQERAKSEFPSLEIAGSYSPPFRSLSIEEKKNIAIEINNKKPHFVFVSLGCPKQERWMADNKDLINSCMVGVGGAFPVYAGIQKRAPKWMQKYSLEWLYRLIQEPGRLWKRYFYTNTLFMVLIIQFYFKNTFLKGNR